LSSFFPFSYPVFSFFSVLAFTFTIDLIFKFFLLLIDLSGPPSGTDVRESKPNDPADGLTAAASIQN
ncbi:hypothetical protein, partial [Holdemania massiliensis]|uniref:hypothetical protein n=1 Tax=Holdemania massiliensis TaxID=1468449 RepID=UPI00356947D7